MTNRKQCKLSGSKAKHCGSQKSKFAGFIMLATIVGTIFLATSCDDCGHDKTKNNSDSLLTNIKKEYQMKNDLLEKNKEVCLGVSKAISSGDWEKVDELLADDFTYIGDGAEPINKQQYIGFMKNVLCGAMTDMDPINKQQYIGFMKNVLCGAMTDMDMKFLRVIAEGDLVSVDYTNAMTK